MPAALAALVTLVFCAYLALFPAAVGYVYARSRLPFPWKAAVFVPAGWTLAEWLRGSLFTGFPWLTLGYSQVPLSPLAGYAPVLGIYGVSLATVVSAGLLVVLVESVRANMLNRKTDATTFIGATRSAVLMLLALWIVGFALTQVKWTERTGQSLSVALLQGNVSQDVKWTAEGVGSALRTYGALVRQTDAQLVVFPETALPLFWNDVPLDYLAKLAEHARGNRGDVLVGLPERLPSGAYYNSVVSLGSSPVQAYRKRHLVPFGEFIPLRSLLGPVVGSLAIPLQDFSPGAPDQQPLEIAGQRVAINICYEDAFGNEISRQLPEATLLVNVSNVAWFGRSLAPMQHLQISQARALETGRYMLRATNTGMTAIIDERGRVVRAAPQFQTSIVNGIAEARGGATPYVRWGNGALLALSLALALAAMFLGTRRRDQSAHASG